MRRTATAITALTMLASVAPASAQSLDDMLEDALTHWRAATWYVRTGNSGIAALEAEAFRASWAALQQRYKSPPPEFAGDGAWGATLWTVSEFAESAAKAIDADDMTSSARALNGIGSELAAWRARNGRVGFSDHVASYRDAIDKIGALAPKETADQIDAAPLRAAAQQLESAVERLEQDRPLRWRGDDAFEVAIRQNRDGVAALLSALAKPSVSALEIVGLIRVVRSNYWLLFLRYGALWSRGVEVG